MMPSKSQPTQPPAPPATTNTTKNSMPPKKVYTREFKLEALSLLRSSGKTKADIERDLGLYSGQLRLWERAFHREEGNVEQVFPGTGHQNDAEAELSRLRREVEVLRQERDILKKQ
jgi:transposase